MADGDGAERSTESKLAKQARTPPVEGRGDPAPGAGGAWRDEDVIAMVGIAASRFRPDRSEGHARFRDELRAIGARTGPLRPGEAMGDYVADAVRLGLVTEQMAEDLIDEMYVDRGLYEEACGLCRRMAQPGFGCRGRADGSMLVGSVLSSVLGGLQACGEPGVLDDMVRRGLPVSPRCGDRDYRDMLMQRCLDILVLWAKSLGLAIRPSPKENDLVRKGVYYAQAVQYRRRIRGTGEIVSFMQAHYPESCRFLGMGDPRAVERMVRDQVPLVLGVSADMGRRHTSMVRDEELPDISPPGLIESMLKFIGDHDVKIKPRTLKKWRNGMAGWQLGECIFEMDVYLRLVRVGARAETDIRTPKIGERGNVEIDLRVDGCLAEVYAPVHKEVFVRIPETVEDAPGTRLMRSVLRKPQLRHVGKSKTVMIVRGDVGDCVHVLGIREDTMAQLEGSMQPGAIFFVHEDGIHNYVYCFVNTKAVARVPEQTVQTIQRALELDIL